MSAIISDCGLYRYRLERDVAQLAANDGPVYAFFGVNPSTADASQDDATVRKWRGFVQRWGGSRFIVGNVFSFRATDVKKLAGADDPVGPHNISSLESIVADADILVPCWGNAAKVPQQLRKHIRHVEAQLRIANKPLRCFGLTASGDPKHPLMLGYDTPLIDWKNS